MILQIAILIPCLAFIAAAIWTGTLSREIEGTRPQTRLAWLFPVIWLPAVTYAGWFVVFHVLSAF